MQAIILAAGMGKRLKHLTENNTKCMVNVNGISIIERTLRILDRKALNKIVIVVGYEGQKLVNYIESLNVATPITYIWNNDYEKTNNIYSLSLAKEHLCEDDTILLVTEKGYGKQTKVSEYRQTRRGSKGVKAMNITDKNGSLVSVKIVQDNQELVIMTNSGMTMRMPLDQISLLGRVTQGLRLINLKDNQKVSTISLVEKEEVSESAEEETNNLSENVSNEDENITEIKETE